MTLLPQPSGVLAAVDSELLVAETFGPTLQGEGPSAGHPALFLRLSRCNLTCGHGPAAVWACDTPFTWDWSRFDPRAESRRQTVEALSGWVLGHDTRLLVISGGEPLLQQDRLIGLVETLVQAGRRVELETNGTITPHPRLLRDGVTFNVSPKLTGSGVTESKRIVGDALRVLARSRRAVFKFVATGPGDLDEVAMLAELYDLAPVWIMPAGTEAATVLERIRILAEPVIARGWQLTPRLHVLLWGDERGR